MKKQTAVIIAPGRGVYGQSELGYLKHYHQDKGDFLDPIDQYRAQKGLMAITALDAMASYSAQHHASSQHASSLIYACALSDFADIDQDKYEIVAVTGNSLGWYLALAAAKALAPMSAIKLVDTMGGLMEEHGVGGQLVYPEVDTEWRVSPTQKSNIEKALEAANETDEASAYRSIDLGGMAVLAGNEKGLQILEAHLPKTQERFPFRLARHAAFHTPLLAHASAMAQAALDQDLFRRPHWPLIDGQGRVWQPHHDLHELRDYTFGAQITETYSFSRSIEVAIKEFAPDKLIVLGPGTSMGPPIAQELIKHGWRGLHSKSDFTQAQKENPFMLAMGVPGQRQLVV